MKQYNYTTSNHVSLYNGKVLTVMIDVPESEEFLKLLEAPLFEKKLISMHRGIAKKNPKDRFVRKIGRDTADSKAENVEFILYKVSYAESPDIIVVSLQEAKTENNVYIFTLKKGRKHPHFVNCLIESFQ